MLTQLFVVIYNIYMYILWVSGAKSGEKRTHSLKVAK